MLLWAFSVAVLLSALLWQGTICCSQPGLARYLLPAGRSSFPSCCLAPEGVPAQQKGGKVHIAGRCTLLNAGWDTAHLAALHQRSWWPAAAHVPEYCCPVSPPLLAYSAVFEANTWVLCVMKQSSSRHRCGVTALLCYPCRYSLAKYTLLRKRSQQLIWHYYLCVG